MMKLGNLSKIAVVSILMLLVDPVTGQAGTEGMPFSHVYTSKEYGANTGNFDLVCDDYGSVFVGNMEGLIYFDGSSWRKLYTPGISRVTRLAKGSDGRIWFGGYNVIGYLVHDNLGRLRMKMLISDKKEKSGFVVNRISQKDGKIMFATNKKKIYSFPCKTRISFPRQNKCGQWSVEPGGIKCEEVPSPYSHLSEEDGLKGEVLCFGEIGDRLYIGTREGLFYMQGGKVKNVPAISINCLDLIECGKNQLLAVTNYGLYIVSVNGVRQLTGENSLSACIDPVSGDFIVGEIDAVYRVTRDGRRRKISEEDNVVDLSYVNGKLRMRTLDETHINKVDYTDRYGRKWLSDANGYRIQVTRGKGKDGKLPYWLHPLTQKAVTSVYVCRNSTIVFGGEFGAVMLDYDMVAKTSLYKNEAPYIREITVGDSVIWGGYGNGMKPMYKDQKRITLPYNFGSFKINFSAQLYSYNCPIQYRYRQDYGRWSEWKTDAFVDYKNFTYGYRTIEIQSMDIFGRESPVATVKLYVIPPFYLSSWAILLYLIMLIGLISVFFRWRTKRLKRDKKKLEGLVAERTSELTDALDDLKKTQESLVRMERSATAGKLTQGLIDRILNPINYINNFSKLTSGLAKDLKEDVEDEKENMTADNFEDCEDILDMMTQNLQKIEEHGVNTTRTLRAMEAMLNTHIGTLALQDLCVHCRHALTVAAEYHKEPIARMGVKMTVEAPETPVMVMLDQEALSRILISMMTNSIYAVEKKYEQSPYEPEVSLIIEQTEKEVKLTVHDNGIGVEDTIKDKIFDPFFTTKPTGVAAGVGLYLVRELIHDHGANIVLDSERGSYCNFTITFPIPNS